MSGRTLFACILRFFEDNPVKIASDEIAEDYADIYRKYLKCMGLPERERSGEVIEGVGNAMGEAADDEERDPEKKRKIVLLPGEGHCSGHEQAAANAEEAAVQGSCTQAHFKDVLSGRLHV